jgi:hypothetical protein
MVKMLWIHEAQPSSQHGKPVEIFFCLFIFSLRDMLASAPLSGLSFTTAHQPIRMRDYWQLW